VKNDNWNKFWGGIEIGWYTLLARRKGAVFAVIGIIDACPDY